MLFCLIAPLLATVTYLHYQKSSVRKKVKHQIIAGIDKDELVLLKFTEDESQTKLRWEHAKEFEFDGQMYDVVETKIKGDTIYYWCWWDHEETRLNKQLNETVAKIFGDNPQRKDSHKKLAEFYKKLFCNSYSFPLTLLRESESGYLVYTDNYSVISQLPIVPPPRCS